MAATAFHLAVVGMALFHLLARASAGSTTGTGTTEDLARIRASTTTLPLRGGSASAFPLDSDTPLMAAAPPASSDHLRAPSPYTKPGATALHILGVSSMAPQDATAAGQAQGALVFSGVNLGEPEVFSDSRHAPPPTTTLSDDSSSRDLGASAAACQEQDASASARAAPPAPRRPGGCALDTVAAVDAIEAAPLRGATKPATTALLLALPLLSIPFLPPPVAALVALSSMATPARARSDDYFKLNHPTCTVYPYDNDTNSVDRARPNLDMELGAVCLHPLCHADSAERLFSVLQAQRRGRGGDILYVYCAVRTLEGDLSISPWRNQWRVHLPVADPAAAAASGGDICYVELAHLQYREGYYIHCPVGDHRQTYCTEFPEEAIAAAVWEHRSLKYRDTVGTRYATYQAKYKHEEL